MKGQKRKHVWKLKEMERNPLRRRRKKFLDIGVEKWGGHVFDEMSSAREKPEKWGGGHVFGPPRRPPPPQIAARGGGNLSPEP